MTRSSTPAREEIAKETEAKRDDARQLENGFQQPDEQADGAVTQRKVTTEYAP